LWIPAFAILLLRFGKAPIFNSVQYFQTGGLPTLTSGETKLGICLQIPQAGGLAACNIIS
jgi:hypothetical protein